MIKKGITRNKDSNTGATASAHIEDNTTPKESTALSGGASIGAHVLETNDQSPRPSCTIQEILEAHLISDDEFWNGTNPGDVSIDTRNSNKMIAGSHITEQQTQKCQETVPPELLNVVPNALPVRFLEQTQGF